MSLLEHRNPKIQLFLTLEALAKLMDEKEGEHAGSPLQS
jgi:hypothetical protein